MLYIHCFFLSLLQSEAISYVAKTMGDLPEGSPISASQAPDVKIFCHQKDALDSFVSQAICRYLLTGGEGSDTGTRRGGD